MHVCTHLETALGWKGWQMKKAQARRKRSINTNPVTWHAPRSHRVSGRPGSEITTSLTPSPIPLHVNPTTGAILMLCWHRPQHMTKEQCQVLVSSQGKNIQHLLKCRWSLLSYSSTLLSLSHRAQRQVGWVMEQQHWMHSGELHPKASLRVTDHARIQHRSSQGSLPRRLTSKVVFDIGGQHCRSNGISSLTYTGCHEDSPGWSTGQTSLFQGDRSIWTLPDGWSQYLEVFCWPPSTRDKLQKTRERTKETLGKVPKEVIGISHSIANTSLWLGASFCWKGSRDFQSVA